MSTELLERLPGDECALLTQAEAIIARGLTTFVEVGEALMVIRDRRLYRADFATFEDYCRGRWHMTRFYAHRLIEASSVINLLPVGNTPSTERQARELAPLKNNPEQLADEASCAIETQWAPVLDRWARDSGYELRAATEAEQLKGIDRVLRHAEDGVITVDYKCCDQARRTGNLFIETTSNDQTQRAGWAWTSRANFLLYFAIPDSVYVFWMKYLRSMLLPDWIRRWPERSAANGRYNTIGRCVPCWAAGTEADYVANLTRGDGLILQASDRRSVDVSR